MLAIRIICGLAVTVLGTVGLNWVLQDDAIPGEPVAQPVAETAAQPASTASEDVENGFRELLQQAAAQDGFCTGCHKLLGSPAEDPIGRGRGPHKHVVLKHGENVRCFNCHHSSGDKYGSFAAHDGSVIPVETVEQLCGKCHGPHYRAWKRGSHGQRSGYWDPTLGPQSMAHCNDCHDPHQPYFKPPPTLSGPRTLHGELLPDHKCRTKRSHGT